MHSTRPIRTSGWVMPTASQRIAYIDMSASKNQSAELLSLNQVNAKDRSQCVRICCISDTHERHQGIVVPPCGILIHCGDIAFASRFKTGLKSSEKIREFGHWIQAAPALHKIVIGGNHDEVLERLSVEEAAQLLGGDVIYMLNSYIALRGLGVFASPCSTGSSPNRAFQSDACQLEAQAKLHAVYQEALPVDIIIGHSDPLRSFAKSTPSLPQAVLFGHVHAAYGSRRKNGVLSVCASILGHKYDPKNAPFVIDMMPSTAESVLRAGPQPGGHREKLT